MADNPNVVNQDSVNPNDLKQESINPNDVKQDNTDNKSEHSVPYSVFKDTKNQLNEMKTQFAEIQEKQNAARESKMKEEGQLKELLQEKNTLIEQQTNQLNQYQLKLLLQQGREVQLVKWVVIVHGRSSQLKTLLVLKKH